MQSIIFFLFVLLEQVRSWQQLGSTVSSGQAEFSSFGAVVDISHDGRRMAIGAPEYNGGDGSVFIYELDVESHNTSSWNLLATIPAAVSGEGLGDSLSLSDDGLILAVRRHHVTPNVVHVFQVDSSPINKVGSDVTSCQSDGTSVTLGQATIRPNIGSKYWLAIGCESHDDHRGMVQVFELSEYGDWDPYLGALEGRNPGDRFGSEIAFVEAPSPFFASGRVFRMAVASPHFDNNRGLVQVFVADAIEAWSQLGGDLIGDDVGDSFGASIDMSATEKPYVVVGSPQRRTIQGLRGVVELFHWRSPSFGAPSSWHVVGVPLEGMVDNDQFGTSAAISKDGSRIVSSSANHDKQRGYVSVYERDTYDSVVLVENLLFGQEERDSWGESVALSGQGSVVISGSSWNGYEATVGTVRAFLDDSSFCQVPVTTNAGVTNVVVDEFLERMACRNGVSVVTNKQICSETMVFLDGQFVSCNWIGYPSPTATAPPSTHFSLSINPLASTIAPAPSMTPFLSSESPTYKPTNTPSIIPSLKPAFAGYGSKTSVPSSRPTASQVYQTWTPSAVVTESPSTTNPNHPDGEQLDTGAPTAVEGDFMKACPCDKLGKCTNQPLAQGSDVSICIVIEVSDIKTIHVEELSLGQHDLSVSMVDNGLAMSDGVESLCGDDACRVSAPVSSIFFGNGRPAYVVATGSIIVSDRLGRNLRVRRRLGKLLEFQTTFSLDHIVIKESSIENEETEKGTNADAISPLLLWVLLGVLVLAVAFLICRYVRKSGGNSDA